MGPTDQTKIHAEKLEADKRIFEAKLKKEREEWETEQKEKRQKLEEEKKQWGVADQKAKEERAKADQAAKEQRETDKKAFELKLENEKKAFQKEVKKKEKELEDAMDEARRAAEIAAATLRPPTTWSANPDPRYPKKVNLDKNADEFRRLSLHFTNKFGARRTPTVLSIHRIENVALWQSYAAKRKTMLARAEKENVPKVRMDQYEQKYMFHGTSTDVIPKIMNQGFNRIFNGKNAVAYGRGVYFANSSRYSNGYAQTSSNGTKTQFLCRVMVGEYCMGRSGQPVPDERIQQNHVLYDSTTDNMGPLRDLAIPGDDDPRQMFVIYHDAQAYPEYLLEYRES